MLSVMVPAIDPCAESVAIGKHNVARTLGIRWRSIWVARDGMSIVYWVEHLFTDD
jgi:hypothetical protein